MVECALNVQCELAKLRSKGLQSELKFLFFVASWLCVKKFGSHEATKTQRALDVQTTYLCWKQIEVASRCA
jgi:hypothetical protein